MTKQFQYLVGHWALIGHSGLVIGHLIAPGQNKKAPGPRPEALFDDDLNQVSSERAISLGAKVALKPESKTVHALTHWSKSLPQNLGFTSVISTRGKG